MFAQNNINLLQIHPSIATRSIDRKGMLIKRGKSKSRIHFLPGDQRFDIAIRIIGRNERFFPSVKTRRSLIVEVNGTRALLNVKSAARRLHLKPLELRTLIEKGGLERLKQQAERIAGIFNEAARNQGISDNVEVQQLLNSIRTMKKEENGIAKKMRIKGINYLFDRNDDGTIDVFRFQKKMGEGNYGKVHAIQNLVEKKPEIALKIMKKSDNDQKNLATLESAKNEHELLNRIHKEEKRIGIQKPSIKMSHLYNSNNNQNTVIYYAPLYECNYLDFIIELKEIENREPGTTLQSRYFHFLQLIGGLTTLQEMGIMHGDLKPQNILVKKLDDLIVTDISDFGGASANVDNRIAKRAPGTHAYFPLSDLNASLEKNPEIFKEIEMKRDVFALGCVLHMALSFKKSPYPIHRRFINPRGKYEEILDPNVPNEVKELVKEMLHPDYRQRISATLAFDKFIDFLKENSLETIDQLIELNVKQ